MRARSLTLLQLGVLCLASSVAVATTVYRWVDENGVVHFSDQPHPKAKEMTVGPPQTYSAQPAQQADASAERSPASAGRYTACEIARPENDEVFLNTRTVTGRMRLEPRLQAGDRIAIVLDGRRLPRVGPTSELVLTDVDRGTHTLQLIVEDADGQVLCTSRSVTFHVRQPSVQAPNPANRPRF